MGATDWASSAHNEVDKYKEVGKLKQTNAIIT